MAKSISVVLALAMVISCSNILVSSATAFADEKEETSVENLRSESSEEEPKNASEEESGEFALSLNQEEEDVSSEPTADDVGGNEPNRGNETESTGGTEDSDENVVTPHEEAYEEDEAEEPQAPCVFDVETGTVTISGVDRIDKASVSELFKNAGIAKEDVLRLVIVNGESIEASTFYRGYCPNLESVVIKRVKTIGAQAFFGTPKLVSVELEEVERVGTDLQSDALGKSFAECKALSELHLSNIGMVGAEAFRSDFALTALRMSNVGQFGRSVFSYCTGLTSVDIDGERDGITSIGTTMFYGCTGLAAVTIRNVDKVGLQAFYGCKALPSVSVAHVGTIAMQAFMECSALADVSLTAVEAMEGNAFQGCNNLQRLTLNDMEAVDAQFAVPLVKELSLNNIGTIGTKAFQVCKKLQKLTVNEVGTIGEQAFVGLYDLKEATIDKVDAIGVNAFASCKAMEALAITDVDTIGTYAFYNCAALPSVTMSGVGTVSNYAFWKCKNLETVDSLKGVQSIGGFAFLECEKLSGLSVEDATKMGYVGSNEEILKRVQAILAGTFKLEAMEEIGQLQLQEEEWLTGAIGRSENWDSYANGTQLMQQARWSDVEAGVAEVRVDAYYTGEKQMDYIFVADLSGSMSQLGNAADMNARFYDMQSKLMDMTGKLLNTAGYDCNVAIVTFGGENGGSATRDNSGFMSDEEEARAYINGLTPLNEWTDYGLGLQEAEKLVKENAGRNTVVVFLSDGAPNRNTSGDQDGTIAARAIKDMNVPIFGVLHSPAASGRESAFAKMEAVCGEGNVTESFDTASFGKAMNAAFSKVYGTNSVTIPVNAEQFDVSELTASAGAVSYSDGVITWVIEDMPFAQHTLSYRLSLKEDLLNAVGTHTYAINQGNAAFNNQGGASAGIGLVLNRGVQDASHESTPDPKSPVPIPADSAPDGSGPSAPDTFTATIPGGTAGDAQVTPPTTVAEDAGMVIDDDATPLAAAGEAEVSIEDDTTPLASVYDEPKCWMHVLMIWGIALTMLYGLAVVLRRERNRRAADRQERELIGTVRQSSGSSPARMHA